MSKVLVYIAKSEAAGINIEWQRQKAKGMLRDGLQTWLGETKFIPSIAKGVHGKPYLQNSDLYFNISHSQRYVVCAISDEEVGIDIQFHKKDEIDKVARRMMSAKEWQEYQEASDKSKFFYDLWAKKESYIKYTGEGLSVDMRLINIEACVQEIAVAEQYSCMVCTKERAEVEERLN